jgi:hypothetical protein
MVIEGRMLVMSLNTTLLQKENPEPLSESPYTVEATKEIKKLVEYICRR